MRDSCVKESDLDMLAERGLAGRIVSIALNTCLDAALRESAVSHLIDFIDHPTEGQAVIDAFSVLDEEREERARHCDASATSLDKLIDLAKRSADLLKGKTRDVAALVELINSAEIDPDVQGIAVDFLELLDEQPDEAQKSIRRFWEIQRSIGNSLDLRNERLPDVDLN